MIRSHSRLGFQSKSFWITSREEIVHHESSFFGIISLFFVTNNYPSNSVHINMKKEKKNLSNQVKASIYDNFHDRCFTEAFYIKKKKRCLFISILLNPIYAPNRPPPPSLGFPMRRTGHFFLQTPETLKSAFTWH